MKVGSNSHIVPAIKGCATATRRPAPAWARILLGSGLVAALVAFNAIRAAAKPFWYDELFTFYISRLPDWGAIRAALLDGADFNPPVLYALTRAAHGVFGDGHVATRLPQNLGFTVMCICLYIFVARRCGRTYGAVSATIPLVTGAYEYAYEARTYGITFGLAAVALVTWQAAASGRHRQAATVATGLALTGVVLTHCYAILVLVPFWCGEAVRARRRGRIDWPIVASILVPTTGVACYFPLLNAMRSIRLDNSLQQPAQFTFFPLLLAPALWPLSIALVAALLVERTPATTNAGLASWEVAASAGFLAIPAMSAAVALGFAGIYSDRYGMPAIIGVAITGALVVRRAVNGCDVPGFVFAGVLCVWFFVTGVRSAERTTSPEVIAVPFEAIDVASKYPQLPIVASSGLEFLQFDHYGKSDFVARLVYVSDSDAAVKYSHSNVFEVTYPAVGRWFPIRGRIERYDPFVRTNPHFLVFGDPDFQLDWLHRRLEADEAEFQLLYRDRGWMLLHVTIGTRDRRSTARFRHQKNREILDTSEGAARRAEQ